MVTTDSKPPRVAPTAIGKAFHFYASYNGTSLSFSNIVKQTHIDSRDRQPYKTVQIGNQIWMAENLKFYPFDEDISEPQIGSNTIPYYYVYGFTGDFVDPEALQAFSLTGILYNWSAALEGETGSNANPSGVKGICPEGWHLPSSA